MMPSQPRSVTATQRGCAVYPAVSQCAVFLCLVRCNCPCVSRTMYGYDMGSALKTPKRDYSLS